MNKYNIKELKEKIKNNEELKDNEYKVLINYHRNKIIEKMYMNNISDYKDTITKLTLLAAIGTSMGEAAKYLPYTCSYMILTLPLTQENYLNAYQDSETASKILCRYNTLTFVKEVEEIDRFNELTGTLYDSIIEYTNIGYSTFEKNILKDEMDAIGESRGKILSLRNKYFK